MTWAWLLAGFSMGFLGSPHCLGMCGGIVSAFTMSMHELKSTKKVWLIACYHLGRLLSYALLGALVASIGAVFFAPFAGSTLPRLLLGAAIVFSGLLMLGLPMLKQIERMGFGIWGMLSPLRKRLFPLNTTPKALAAGLLWGFLPCGLVYAAVGVAFGLGTNNGATTHSQIMQGSLFMLSFGLGTLPTLVATQTVAGVLQSLVNKLFLRRAGGLIMLISGLLVAYPAVNHAHHHGHHDMHSHTMHEGHTHGSEHNHSEHNHSEQNTGEHHHHEHAHHHTH